MARQAGSKSVLAFLGMATATIAALVALAGCDKAGEILREAKSRNTPPADLFGSDVIAKTAAELETKLGGKLRFLDIMAENGSLRFEYEVPGKKGSVDLFELRRGQLLGPQPVQLIGGGSLEENLYNLSEVDLGCIPELSKKAIAKLGFEDAKVSSLRLHKKEPAGAIQLRIKRQAVPLELKYILYVDSPRSKGMIEADPRCEIVKDIKF